MIKRKTMPPKSKSVDLQTDAFNLSMCCPHQDVSNTLKPIKYDPSINPCQYASDGDRLTKKKKNEKRKTEKLNVS